MAVYIVFNLKRRGERTVVRRGNVACVCQTPKQGPVVMARQRSDTKELGVVFFFSSEGNQLSTLNLSARGHHDRQWCLLNVMKVYWPFFLLFFLFFPQRQTLSKSSHLAAAHKWMVSTPRRTIMRDIFSPRTKKRGTTKFFRKNRKTPTGKTGKNEIRPGDLIAHLSTAKLKKYIPVI